MAESNALTSAIQEFGKHLKELDCKPRVAQLEIDGLMYTSSKLPATVGLDVWPRVLAMFGPPVVRAMALGDDEMDLSALMGIAERASQSGVTLLIRDLLQRMDCGCLYTSKKPGKVLSDFDEHFAGEYMHLLKVVAFSIAHNLRGPMYGVR